MAFKVQIPAGVESVAARGLYQWDYGQTLEIECAEIGTETVEVHFACPNMTEAIVRACTFTSGTGTVKIPDICLEQTREITAWICKADSTQCHTIKTIILHITARTRPSNTRDVPADYVDTFGQLIEEVNEAIDALEKGNVTAAKATLAATADKATTATSAATATYATTAGAASKATTLEHLYCHIVTIDVPLYSKAGGTDASDLMGTVRLSFNVTSPNKTFTGAYKFTDIEVDKQFCCDAIYISPQNAASPQRLAWISQKGEAASSWYKMEFMPWDGFIAETGYYNRYTPSVTTISLW